MPNPLKIAAIQLQIQPMQIEENFRRAASYIHSAAATGARLAVLPEYCLTGGWSTRLDDALANTNYLERFCELAKELRICIVPGSFAEKCRDAAGRDVIYNNTYFIDDTGAVLHCYSKKHLWHVEIMNNVQPGHGQNKVIETPLGRVGLLLCWDLMFQEEFRELAMQCCDLIIIPSMTKARAVTPAVFARNPNGVEIGLRHTLTSRAYENEAIIVYANAGGRGFVGMTQIAAPILGAVEIARGKDEEVVMAEVDMDVLKEARECTQMRIQYLAQENLARKSLRKNSYNAVLGIDRRHAYSESDALSVRACV